jgi:hypothetical protein
MNIYEQRWSTVQQYFERLNTLIAEENFVVYFQDMRIVTRPTFTIDVVNKEIQVIDDNCTHVVYSGDPELDEGVHDNVETWLDEFRVTLQLLIPYEGKI